MLYTSYISKISKMPDDMNKILIVRFLPKGFDLSTCVNLKHRLELAPSKELLLSHKANPDWARYVREFNLEMQNRKDMREYLQQVLKYLQKGNDLCLICYEKDFHHCHRYLLAQWFIEHGIKWKEWDNK